MGKSNKYGQLYAYENGEFVPVSVGRPGRRPKYPIHKLDVGDSFFVEGAKGHVSAVYQTARRKGIKVIQRPMTEEDEYGNPVKGVRVWRVK